MNEYRGIILQTEALFVSRKPLIDIVLLRYIDALFMRRTKNTETEEKNGKRERNTAINARPLKKC